MPNLLERGANWLAGKLQDVAIAGRSVTYSRGSSSVAITAAAVMVNYEVIEPDGMPTSVLSRDYMILATDLVLSSEAVTPRKGDRLAETINGEACVFEVLSLGSKPCWEWAEGAGVILMVHTKRVAA